VSSKTPDSRLRCTLDGSTPDLNTAAHSNPIDLHVVKTGTVVKCITTAHGKAMSAVTTSDPFRIKSYPPVFEPDGGGVTNYADVTISSKAGQASTILYHYTDSLHPEKSAQIRYKGGFKIDVTGTVLTAVASEDGKLPSDTVISNPFEISCAPVEFYAAGEWQPGFNQTSEEMYFVDKVCCASCPSLPTFSRFPAMDMHVCLECRSHVTNEVGSGMDHYWVAYRRCFHKVSHQQDGRFCQGLGYQL